MKPVTDDVVFSILEGLEKRERSKKAAAQSARIALPDRILASMGNRRVIALGTARRRARQTVSGMFCYVARNG